MSSGDSEPFYAAEEVAVYGGDCLEVMQDLAPESVDVVITDPPYGIDMATSGWDRPSRLRGGLSQQAPLRDGVGAGFERWAEDWAEGCLRWLKPGGHLIAFGGPRMWHRLASGIENAGFEIRDQIAWLYATGYPKSRDISAAIDHQHGAVRLDRVTVAQHHGATYYAVDGVKGAGWSNEKAFTEVERIDTMISFEPDPLEIAVDGVRQHLAPGQAVTAHGLDRGLDADEVNIHRSNI